MISKKKVTALALAGLFVTPVLADTYVPNNNSIQSGDGYLTADDGQEYFPNVIVSTVKGSLDSLENRMASLLFKMAVELSMTLHVTAAANQIDADTLSRLRGLCVEEVKRLHGAVRLEDAVKFQNGM